VREKILRKNIERGNKIYAIILQKKQRRPI
jgi:hypothetical protein